jgi:hypothetical protein
MDRFWHMPRKRTNVYADPENLAITKEAARASAGGRSPSARSTTSGAA